MFFLYNSHPFYILSSEIDLRKNPHLRLLQFDLNLNRQEIRESQGDVIRWFNSICESVTSNSLIVEVDTLFMEVAICDKIQDTLLALRERIETFSVYLASGTKEEGLFPKLYTAGLVVEEDIWPNKDKEVGYCILTPSLLCSFLSCLASFTAVFKKVVGTHPFFALFGHIGAHFSPPPPRQQYGIKCSYIAKLTAVFKNVVVTFYFFCFLTPLDA